MLPAHLFHASELRTPCALPFAGPCELLLVLSRLSCVLGELRILPESQGVFEDDDADPLQVERSVKLSLTGHGGHTGAGVATPSATPEYFFEEEPENRSCGKHPGGTKIRLPKELETLLVGLVIYIVKVEFVLVLVVKTIVVVVVAAVWVTTRAIGEWLRGGVMCLKHGICFAELLELCGSLCVPLILVRVRTEGQLCVSVDKRAETDERHPPVCTRTGPGPSTPPMGGF
jgi:hypothetical protein